MESDKDKWNQRFSSHSPLKAPEAFFLKNLRPSPGKSLLDLACGEGRNGIYFATNFGVQVSGLDISDVGLENLKDHAKAQGVVVSVIHQDLDELEDFSQIGTFDYVIINYFKPSCETWSQIHQLLSPKGQIFLCTFSYLQHENHGFPLKFCLAPLEFENANRNLTTTHYESFEENGKFLDGYIFSGRSTDTP